MDRITRLKRVLEKAEHLEKMKDPEYKALYEKFGDPAQLGRTHARLIIAQRKGASHDHGGHKE